MEALSGTCAASKATIMSRTSNIGPALFFVAFYGAACLIMLRFG